jgi:DNA-binding NtrC family response regulator
VQERKFERIGGRETLDADVRIVAATNRDLPAMANAGQFRSDLYFRLRVVEIEIPPLRSRGGDDIIDLASHFTDQFARRYRKGPMRLSESAKPALTAYAWPGNVRELEHSIERAVVLVQGPTIGVKDLGLEPRRTTISPGDSQIGMSAITSSTIPLETSDTITLPPDLELEEAERRYARAILDRCDGNQSAAARALGISRNKLARLLKSE